MTETKVKRYETFSDGVRSWAGFITHPIARVLEKWGLHPNTITLVGFGACVAVAFVLARGHLALGGALLLLASSLDGLDGTLARLTGAKSRFGAFLDSTLDRLSEGALLFGLLVALTARGATLEIYLIYLILFSSIMVSYTRARAEGVGYPCEVGLFSRLPRVLLLGIGLIIGWIRPMLIIMAVLTWLTVLQRILHVYRVSRQAP